MDIRLKKFLGVDIKNKIANHLKVLLLLTLFFLNFSGMKVILKDGNLIEVSNYRIYDGFTRIELRRERLDIPNHLIDIRSTLKLLEIETKGFSIVKSYSSLLYYDKDQDNFYFQIENKKEENIKTVPKIKLETRKELNPFFMELPDQKTKDEDFLDKLKKKGIFLKLNIPVKH